MSDLEYGVNVANKFDLLFGDEDPSEALSQAAADPTKKKDTVLKEKPARGKSTDASKDNKKPHDGKKQDTRARNVPAGQQQGQRQPRNFSGRPEQGKENSTRPQRTEGQRPGNGPRRFGGPRPEGGAPRRSDQDFGTAGGDQEVPEQRAGFGGRGGYRGGFRGGRASPRFPREQTTSESERHGGRREYERHSGSNKTGVKSTQKREGGGAHNWGSYKDELEAKPEEGAEKSPQKVAGEEGQTENVEATETQPQEPEVRELTLKEYMEEMEGTRTRPKYNSRQANEGESEQKVFQKMKRVQRETANSDGMIEVVEYVEVDVDNGQKGGLGGPFQFVFAPTAQVSGDRPTRGGPRGGFRGGRGGPGRQPQQQQQHHHQRGGNKQAPPAADELNFPPLG